MSCRALSRMICILIVSAALLPFSTAWADLKFDLLLRVISQTSPETATIHCEKEPRPLSLVRQSSDPPIYIGEITMGSSGTGGSPAMELGTRYDVALTWEKENAVEVLYLSIGPGTSRKIECEIFHEKIGTDHDFLVRIGALPKEYRSQSRCYFQARAFHREWRHVIQQPLHEAALLSAKHWFDSAAWLSTRPNSIFLMDPEAREIMLAYENLAIEDKSFRRRYRKIVNPGYVDEMLVQTDVAKYSAVGTLASLIKSGRIEEARTINDGAKAALALETTDTRRNVVKYQGVNLKMLKGNAGFLKTLLPAAQNP